MCRNFEIIHSVFNRVIFTTLHWDIEIILKHRIVLKIIFKNSCYHRDYSLLITLQLHQNQSLVKQQVLTLFPKVILQLIISSYVSDPLSKNNTKIMFSKILCLKLSCVIISSLIQLILVYYHHQNMFYTQYLMLE